LAGEGNRRRSCAFLLHWPATPLKTSAARYFLELLLATYKRSSGAGVNPFGLSEAALKGAEMIAERMGWPLSQVVEDAIAARCRDFNIAKGKKSGMGRGE